MRRFFLIALFLVTSGPVNTRLILPRTNTPPEPVRFIKPDWTGPELDWADFADEDYTLYWQDEDPDDNAHITLFYDNDQNYTNGYLGTLATGISEDADERETEYVWNTGMLPEGSFVWHTTSVPNGAYYVGAVISDSFESVTSYSTGRVRVYHFPKISYPYENAGLASVWSDPYTDNPQLVHRHLFFHWDKLEPCGDDHYYWEVNPSSGRYYDDPDDDGICADIEGPTYNRFKEKIMEQLYKKVDPDCTWDCEFKQPLELIHPGARVYLHINGPGPGTLQYNRSTRKYEKGNYWLFDHVALLRTPDGDYNANGRRYPSVQFWAPSYKAYYRDLLEDLAAELKSYAEIYPYISLVRAQFNAFNAEGGSCGSGATLSDFFSTLGECNEYIFDHSNYDPDTRYNRSLTKKNYRDTDNQQRYYFEEANDYHGWVAQTYFDIFKNDPEGKLNAEIVIKPRPTDEHLTPPQVFEGFLYQMIYQYGVWFYKTSMRATGYAQDDLTWLVHGQKIARGYTEPRGRYDRQEDSNSIIPERYDNPLQWTYWHVLLDLHRGIDMISFYGDTVARCRSGSDETYCAIFEFLNRYAGLFFSPATSRGAWIAFRPLFHPEDLSGNLEMHITQLDADGTSNRLFGYDSCKGDSDCRTSVNLNPPKPSYWNCERKYCPDDGYFGDVRNGKVVNLGPKTQPYGIWARSVGANRKHAITLDVHDDFAGPACPAGPIEISVIYLDRGTDSFTLKYNSPSGLRAIRFEKGNTGVWKGDQASDAIRVTDFCFNNAVNGGDLQLSSNGDGEDILHMVKLERPDEYFVLKVVPPARVIGRGDVATYTVDVRSVGVFTHTVTLSVVNPSPDLELTLTPTAITPPGRATLTVTDTHNGTALLPGLWYRVPITGSGGGFVKHTSAGLLVGGARFYLPLTVRE